MAEEVLRAPARARVPLSIVHTSDSVALVVLRIGLGLVMFPHGAQKLLGWFGGNGFAGTMNFFTSNLQIPAPVAFLVIVGEFFGALLLLTGFLTRIAAAAITAIMLGAIVLVHARVGFFMDWSGTLAGEGFEFHLLAIAIGIALMLGGGGMGSIDRLLEVYARKDLDERP